MGMSRHDFREVDKVGGWLADLGRCNKLETTSVDSVLKSHLSIFQL